MINNEWFPTPKPVCLKMYSKIKERLNCRSRILDPEAGNGGILDYIIHRHEDDYNYGKVTSKNIFAIELEYEFRFILSGKGYNVIGTDFLDYSEPTLFDLVIMNPPFSVGAKHVNHAWKFVKPGGQLVALLNAETVRNPHTADRILLSKLLSDHGEVEELGQCFKDSERPTNVEVVMVSMIKPSQNSGQFGDQSNFAGFESGKFEFKDDFEAEEFVANPIAHTNLIKALVAQYDAAVASLIAKIEANSKPTQKYLEDQLKKVSDEKCNEFTHTDKVDSRWFTMRYYKKGTLHLEFKDLEVLKEFNRRAAIGKQWIPDETSAPKVKYKRLAAA
jgi:SAM-dependent methyltransferase